MKIYRLLLGFLLLGGFSFGQGPLTFPALSTNNTFTGTNTFSGATTVCSLNGIQNGAVPSCFATVQAAINACIALTSCNEVYIPAGVYSQSTGPLTCTPGNNGWIRIHGAGMDASTGTILRFTGATDGVQLNGECTADNVDIDGANASGGIALRASGLNQFIWNVHVTKSGSGLWAKGIQALGVVTDNFTNVYTENTCCTIGAEVAPNGVNAVGALSFFSSELRGVTTGLHITGNPGPLSVTVTNGSIELNGSNGLLDDSTGGIVSLYGTHLEQNGLIGGFDFNLTNKVGGSLNLFTTAHPGGTQNILSCPNTTCTATVIIDRLLGNVQTNCGGGGVSNCGNITIGTTVGKGSSIANSQLAGGRLTINDRSRVFVFGNSSLDGTPVRTILGDRGDGPAIVDFCSSNWASIGCLTLQEATTGTFSFINNGVVGEQIGANGFFQIPANFPQQFVEGASAGASAGVDTIYGDSTAHCLKTSYNNGSFLCAPQVIGSGTAAMTTAGITAGNCGTTVTVAAAGVATTDTITWAFNAAPAGSNAGLVAWPTSGNVNFAYCPNSAETPAAATINWKVVR